MSVGRSPSKQTGPRRRASAGKTGRSGGINIAIIGGGTRCKSLLEMFAADRFKHLKARVMAVADINPEAPGLVFARELGIRTTSDYQDFFHLQDLDLVIELTGKEELLRDVLKNKSPQVQVLDYAISRLVSDLVTFAAEYQAKERDLNYYRHMIETMFASITEPMLWLRPDYEIVDVNEPMLRMIGLPREEVVGRGCHQIIHRSLQPCSLHERGCPVREALETGRSAHYIHEHLDGDQRLRLVETSAHPLYDHQGEITMVFEFFRDITSDFETRLERKAQQIKKDLARLVHEDKMIALGKLVASSVHEINNPIAGIHALAKLMRSYLQEGELDQEKLADFRRYLELIEQESRRCGEIVSNLLSFSRQKAMERRPLRINDIIRSVVLLSQHRLQLQKIALVEELGEDLPEFLGDHNQIQQCLMNLVFNAVEAMPNGGRLTLKTSYDAKRDMVRVVVSDTGCGIPEEKMSTIFEPFFTTKTEDKGVGLGLSVVYGIIREHRGTIFVKSEVGKGSSFILRFPVFRDTSGPGP